MAVYSLTGNDSSPFHAEPAHPLKPLCHLCLGGSLGREPLNASEFREPTEWPEPEPVKLESHTAAPASRARVSADFLQSLLREPLPAGPMIYGLNCRGDQRVEFYPQAGLKIAATALRPGPDACDSSVGALIPVDDRGRSAVADAPIVQEAMRRGWIVWTVDTRRVGDLKTDLDSFVFATSLLLGESFTWPQSIDILRVLRRVGARSRIS